ncbi:hypothetical protein GCM10009117_08440 [Gangjinia marincola]|uniref:Uncharacterized protein n=1 Tax=Gangjinia marincola TaxID=578463 RepID=A0ABP3XTL8_9FLAO
MLLSYRILDEQNKTMEINFNYDGVTKSERLEDFSKEKLGKLFEHYDFLIRADVFFKTENTTSTDTGMVTSIRLSAPGPRLFTDTNTNTFEDGIQTCVNELTRQLKKRKEKMKSF